MINSNNKEFDKVYNKLIKIIDIKTRNLLNIRELGKSVNYNTIKLLNLYIRYLYDIKQSKYEYFTIDGLNNISNVLNRI